MSHRFEAGVDAFKAEAGLGLGRANWNDIGPQVALGLAIVGQGGTVDNLTRDEVKEVVDRAPVGDYGLRDLGGDVEVAGGGADERLLLHRIDSAGCALRSETW